MALVVEDEEQVPNLQVVQDVFQYEYLRQQSSKESGTLQSKIIAQIRKGNMTPYYLELCKHVGWSVDEELANSMSANNATTLANLEEKIAEAIQNAGDVEHLDALYNKATHFARIGEWPQALAVFDIVINHKKSATNKKIDSILGKSRIAMFQLDISSLKPLLLEASKLIEQGGDWDRRNKMKVYDGIYNIMIRDIKKASATLQESIATFTCTDVCSYEEFMLYAIVCSVLTLSRSDLKKKIIDNAQVVGILIESAELKLLIESLHACDFSSFMQALISMEKIVMSNRFLAPHSVYLFRELRILAFAQFLEAYKSVTLSCMATSFGISSELLDHELSRFIAANRLNAKIDKVGDVVVTNRADKRNAQYQEVIKKGDVLLNQIQKLVRSIEE